MTTPNVSLADILTEIANADKKRKALSLPIPAAQIATLNEVKDRYVAGNPYRVGDIVTPRKSSSYNGRGTPHMIIEVSETPIRNIEGSVSSSAFGSRLDVRVIRVDDEHVVPFWMESFQLELWEAPKNVTIN